MKYINIFFIIFVVILNFGSCTSTKTKRQHYKIIRTELKKYSDILDLCHSEIHLYGIGYSWSSTTPCISMALYVKPIHYNRETLNELSIKLIEIFNNDFYINDYFSDEGMMIWKEMFRINIYFILKEGKKHNIYYKWTYEKYEWAEEWCEIPIPYR